MKQLVEAKETQLFWEQLKASQWNFYLRSVETVFAQLNFRSALSTLAEANSGGEQWTIKRIGFFSTRVTIRLVGSDVDLVTYHPDWTGAQGNIQFSTGQEYKWSVVNFMRTRFTISREGGNELISYLSGSRAKKFSNIFKQEAQVVITSDAWQIRELPILVLLGWYLAVLNREDSNGVTVTASIGVLY
jgi:hypothetical protein